MRAVARSRRQRALLGRRLLAAPTAFVIAGGLTISGTAGAAGSTQHRPSPGGWESLDGSGDNPLHPTWGMAGTNYPRVAPVSYADGLSKPVDGPNARYISNRIISDGDQTLISPRGVSQWSVVWGQFLDHTFALRLGGSRNPGDPHGEEADFPYNNADPLELFRNDLGINFFGRSVAAPGTGVTNPRQQVNILPSYINAYAVYGADPKRLAWMRDGAKLFMPGDYLPRRDSRGDASTAPQMGLGGLLVLNPSKATVAGDQRANENIGLLGAQTLFAREHNRIVSLLPGWLPEEDKFQIARSVVIAEQQWITYTEFLPSLGVRLPRYTGFKPNVDTSISSEFATVGYRAHSMIPGDFKVDTSASRYTQAQLDGFKAAGAKVTVAGSKVKISVPLDQAFFSPDLVTGLGLGPLLQGLDTNTQSKNDEQIVNGLRSALFYIPVPGNPTCQPDPSLPKCGQGVNDLPATDIQRGRDHGIPDYNTLRQAYGLPAKTSFTAITGESTDAFPHDPLLTPGNEINSPHIMDFTALYDAHGKPTTGQAGNATQGVRRTTVAARLKAIYGSVDKVDPFVGMISEPPLPGREFGETQLAIWSKQFTALRDGDRYFYGNNPLLPFIQRVFGIDYRKTLGDLIALNTDVPRRQMPRNVFFTQGSE